ncbi:hypothetical protein MRX96_014724 [Rhipicephalus microplus]
MTHGGRRRAVGRGGNGSVGEVVRSSPGGTLMLGTSVPNVCTASVKPSRSRSLLLIEKMQRWRCAVLLLPVSSAYVRPRLPSAIKKGQSGRQGGQWYSG